MLEKDASVLYQFMPAAIADPVVPWTTISEVTFTLTNIKKIYVVDYTGYKETNKLLT
jgi:hypothetical protein